MLILPVKALPELLILGVGMEYTFLSWNRTLLNIDNYIQSIQIYII